MKTYKQIFIEYKHMMQYCVDIFCIGFIDFMLKDKNLIDFTDLFSPNNLKKNDDIILNYFKNW